MILPTLALSELKINDVKIFPNDETYNGSTRFIISEIIQHIFSSF